MTQAGIPHQAASPQIEERHRAGEAPEDYVLRLAQEKSMAIPPVNGQLVLAADTVVVVSNESGPQILEKPLDGPDAVRMLQLLSGQEHEVLTGLCLRSPTQAWTAVERTRVFFCALTHNDLTDYVASGEPFDKAGAYAIQGLAGKFIWRIEGCYFNVVGLPLHAVHKLLKDSQR